MNRFKQIFTRIAPALRAAFFLILGVLFAYAMFGKLTDGLPAIVAPEATKRGKDTMLISLVNLPGSIAANMDTARKASKDTSFAATPANGQFAVKGVNRLPFGRRQEANMSKLESEAVRQARNKGLPLWAWIMLLGSGMLLTGWAIYKKLPERFDEFNKDRDPAELLDLFQLFRLPIQQLNNPRKIKRLANRVRFQYHYLNRLGLFQNASDLQTFMRIRLQAEKGLDVYPLLNTIQHPPLQTTLADLLKGENG